MVKLKLIFTQNLSIYLAIILMLSSTLSFAKVDSYRLSWRSNPATSMVIGWNQVSGDEAILYYDTKDHKENIRKYKYHATPNRIIKYKGMTNCFVRLQYLKPDTAYYFIIKDSEGLNRKLWFKTAPSEQKPFTFIAGGDSRSQAKPRRDGNKLVAKLRPLFILFSGDFTYRATPKQWAEWFKDWQLTISGDGRIYPIIAIHGNHENSDLKMLTNLFDTPRFDQYYSFKFCGNLMRIWVLNTELAYIAQDEVEKQQEWIEADLSRHDDAKWKIVAYHRPMRPHTKKKKEGEKQIAAWAKLFFHRGVNLIVEADTHMTKQTYPVRPYKKNGSYEGFIRDDKKGYIFIGEGGWGAPKKPADDNKPWTMACDSFYQFKWIQVFPKELLIRTVKFKNVDKVKPLTEKNLFKEPNNMKFWEPPTGKILRLPFNVNNPTYHPPKKKVIGAITNKNGKIFTDNSFETFKESQ